MRSIDQTDFETNNIEVLQFWVMSPFTKTLSGIGNTTGGDMYIDLGSVSEDILKDGKKEFENGLNTPNINAEIDSTSIWGKRYRPTRYRSRQPSDMTLPTGPSRTLVWMV